MVKVTYEVKVTVTDTVTTVKKTIPTGKVTVTDAVTATTVKHSIEATVTDAVTVKLTAADKDKHAVKVAVKACGHEHRQ